MKKNYGLNPLPADDRDFSLGGLDFLPSLDELPADFIIKTTITDQGQTDWCSAHATCGASEAQEGVQLEPAYSFAASKEISGNVEGWGQNLRDAMAAHVKFGALNIADVRPSTKDLSEKEKRYFDNWREYLDIAKVHKKRSYFRITGQYSDFDNIRAALFKYKTPVVIGIKFGYPLKQIHIQEITDGYGHAMRAVGWKTYVGGTIDLIIANSYSEKAGDSGVHYVSKEVINHYIPTFGAYTFIDIDPETVKYNQSHNILLSDNWLVQFYKLLKSFFKKM